MGVAAAVAAGVWIAGHESPPRVGRGPDPDAPRQGAPLSDVPMVELTSVPASYRLVYRVELWRSGERSTSTEELLVRRPFEGVRERRRGQTVQDRTRTALGRLTLGPVGQQVVVATAPGAAVGDLRLDTVLEEALDDGRISRREVREVAGNACQVYRFAGPIGTGGIEPPETSEEWADLCFDARGLLLEEVWVVGGRVRQRRLAEVVEVDPVIEQGRFAFEDPLLDPKRGGGSLRPVDLGSRPPGPFWELATPPPGFTAQDRFALVPPVDESAAANERSRIGSVVDLFVAGPDFIAIDQGGTINQVQALPKPGPDSRTEAIDGLGKAELLLSIRTNEVRVLLDRGRFLRVYGTRPLDELLTVARSLRQTGPDGSGLVYLDG